MTQVLRFDKVSFRYHTPQGETLAVKELSFGVGRGEFVAIIGPSGCGKSTVLSLAAGLLAPSEGRVLSENVTFGYMLQRDELFPWRTIEKNILLPLEIRKQGDGKQAIALAEKYGLKDFLKSYPRELSGGMRQRAALIRTLALKPDILLLDEPFSALDYQTRLSVSEDVFHILREQQKTALLITHDISEAISLADRIIVLTGRPATVKASHESGYHDLPPLKRREDGRFASWFELLWKELNE